MTQPARLDDPGIAGNPPRQTQAARSPARDSLGCPDTSRESGLHERTTWTPPGLDRHLRLGPLGATLLALGAALVAPDAQALDPYMWGVGPRIGTNVIPGAYPVAFPPAVTDEVNGGTIEKVRTDVVVGVDAVYYVTGHTRMGMTGGVGFGKAFFDGHFIVKYNYVSQTGAMDFLLGGGAGFGASRWSGSGSELLRVPYYPLRAEASALVRDNSRGYQGTVFFQYNLPANHFYTNADGDDVEVGTGFYPTAGVELVIYFGDFTPPRPRRRGGGGDGGGAK